MTATVKFVIFAIVIAVLLPGMCAADVPEMLNPFDNGAKMVQKGIDSFCIGLADDMFDLGFEIGGNNSGTNSSVSNAVFSFATFTFDPFQLEGVQNIQHESAIVFLIIIFLYIFGGATMVIISRFAPEQMRAIDYILGTSNRSFAFQKYIWNLCIAVFVMVFGYFAVKFVLVLNYVLTSLLMVGVMDSIAPTPDNVILYFIMAVLYLIMSIFFAWRTIVIGLVAAFALVLGGLYVMEYTRPAAVLAVKYFLSLTFMQVIIVAVTSGGVLIIQGLKDLILLPASSELTLYLALMLLLVAIGLFLVLGPIVQYLLRIAVKVVV